MAKRQEIPDILGQLRQPVNVLDDVLSGRPLGTFPKEVDYPIDRIIIGKRLRPVKDVTELAASMAESGLLQRIVLLPDGTLVVGGHRVAAAKQLGWTTIPARIAELDEVDAELAEIDENLYRRELTVLEQAEHLQRRMELLEIKGQRAKAGDNQHSDATTTAAVADSIGISERSAQQRLQIARGLTQAARDALRDTELAESTTKLLELAKQPQEYQVAIIGKMVNEGYQSVDMAALAVMPRKPAAVKDITYDAWCKQTDKRCTCDGMLFLSMHREDKDPAGAIKSARIDCYCSTCNGTQTWQANQEKGWHLVRSTTEHPVPAPAVEEPPADDSPSIAMVEDPAPVRVVVDAELFGVACDAISAAELGHNKIRKPFLYNNAMWTCVGTIHGGINHPEHNEADCLRLHVLGEPIAPGERITRYLESAYQAGTVVKCGGFTYVLGAQWMLVRTVAKDSAPAVNVVQSEATGSRQQGAELAKCSVCHRPLSDPASAIAGVGPCCAAKRTTAAGSGDAALDVLAPDRNEPTRATQKRNERIDSVLRRLYAAQAAASEFEELTGVYTHTPAFRRVMENMISVLEANRI